MADAMILPCGHTFGSGGIEQVKQMVTVFYFFKSQSLLLLSAIYFSCLWILSMFRRALLESLLHMFAAGLRRLDNPKSQ